jgi:DNA mismatch endonuclease (patch repair protein)
MRGVRSKDTSIELMVRRALHAKGYRYRLHEKHLPGTPDMVFPGRRKVIFIHGCFWHQHRGCPRAKLPTTNTEYWLPKLSRNVKRDQEAKRELAKLGWLTFVIWECELDEFDKTIRKAAQFLEMTAS